MAVQDQTLLPRALLDPEFTADDQLLLRKVLWRLIPFCILCYILNYLDRVNISMAKLKMIEVVPGFDEKVFSLGAAVFFVGYSLFELPSNLIQQRVGPRRWIARIMISWGIISACFVFTRGPLSFYGLRFMLGLAEAGFFPGMILYLSQWIPHHYRARAAALFLTSTAIAGVIGNPLSGLILYATAGSPLGLASWQWLFVIEGVPTVIVGILTLYFLTDRPEQARWLSAPERDRLAEIMSQEHQRHPAHHASDLRHAFASRYTWMLSAIYALVIFGFYTVNFYTPTIIKESLQAAGSITPATPDYVANLRVGLLAAIPFSIAAIGMVIIGRHSDRCNERKNHVIFTCLLIFTGLALAGAAHWLQSGILAEILIIAGLSIGALGTFGVFGPFWALPPQFLTGTAAAAAFAIINSIGNLMGGFIAPSAFSAMSRQHGLFLAAGLALVGALVTAITPLAKTPHQQPS